MKKTAYVSVTYLWTFERSDLGLPEDTSDDEFEAAVNAHMEKATDQIGVQADIFPNDIEVSIA